MSEIPPALHDLIADLAPLEGAFSPVLSMGRCSAANLSLSDITDDCARRLMADVALSEPDGDAKLAAAYLIATVSWNVCEPLAGLALRGLWIVAAKQDAIALSERFVHWEQDREKGVSLTFDLTINETAVAFADVPAPREFAKVLEQLHAPLIETLHRVCGLSRSALWRLVSDSLASAFLEQGRAIDQAEIAIGRARRILRDRGSKLFNKQTNFEWISLPEAPDIGDWMRLRGGCCRYYTSGRSDAEYCTTCVLRSADSRRDRYRDHLRQTKLS
ncbi:hypothetical protein L0664_13230 [Octadecabacter sp. G9-8]|uniref:Ferric siderophore reductase C-terminal domain-containing protein n=1 Tax=Octadecabacter dasysiphoniae TaxID=2909341 RepID=A0ABS9CXN8_9RHOB|nr:(2Fe-2S)-binding protein [Octadecabacter dasysiphoniae]MCF2872031.1 hypothetical protein [Octadecabacter dasysiphoniae]